MDSIREKYSAPYMGTERERAGMTAAEVMAVFEIEAAAMQALDNDKYRLAKADYYSIVEGADERARTLSARLSDPVRFNLPSQFAEGLSRIPGRLAEIPDNCDEPQILGNMVPPLSLSGIELDDVQAIVSCLAEMLNRWLMDSE